MQNPSALRATTLIVAVLATAHCLGAQTPSAVKEVQGLPPRVAPADYRAQAKVGDVIIAAEFTGHGIPNAQEPLNSENYVAVEVGLFGPADAHLTITATDFSLRINGKKEALPSRPWGMAAKEIKDPEWVPADGAAGPKSKGGISGSGGGNQEAGSSTPLPPKVPIELLRNWQARLRRAALAEGDRVLPQAGLVFFQHRGKIENIKSVELIYEGPAGKAALTLQ